MKFQVKFPDGRVEAMAHSSSNIEELAVSGFGKKLTELEAEGYELTPIDEEVITASDVGDLNDLFTGGGSDGSSVSSDPTKLLQN